MCRFSFKPLPAGLSESKLLDLLVEKVNSKLELDWPRDRVSQLLHLIWPLHTRWGGPWRPSVRELQSRVQNAPLVGGRFHVAVGAGQSGRVPHLHGAQHGQHLPARHGQLRPLLRRRAAGAVQAGDHPLLERQVEG